MSKPKFWPEWISCKKINEIIDKESPLVVALALLTTIRVHEQVVNGTSN